MICYTCLVFVGCFYNNDFALFLFIINISDKIKNSLSLPIVRVKKIMKTEDFALQELKRIEDEQKRENEQEHTNLCIDDTKKCIFMISAEGPIFMAKAAELFIRDITTRAWKHTDTNRRKTIQKSDIIHSTSETEMYDFLIDIIPRFPPDGSNTTTTNTTSSINNNSILNSPSLYARTYNMVPPPTVTTDGTALMGSPTIAMESINSIQQSQQQQQQQQSIDQLVSYSTTTNGTEPIHENEQPSFTLENISFASLKEQQQQSEETLDRQQQQQQQPSMDENSNHNNNSNNNGQNATYYQSSQTQQWTLE
jgi:Histone-like transcription factor (CBF/NF-Y) and archaeal histone